MSATKDYFTCQECGLSDEVMAVVKLWRDRDSNLVTHDLFDALDELSDAAERALENG